MVKTGREPHIADEGAAPSLSQGVAADGAASRPATPQDLIDLELQKIDDLLTRMEAISAQLRTR